jgi:hypothetical protein
VHAFLDGLGPCSAAEAAAAVADQLGVILHPNHPAGPAAMSRFWPPATSQYAPRLQDRLGTEEILAVDAERGWPTEVERHRCTAERIRRLLAELREQARPSQ